MIEAPCTTKGLSPIFQTQKGFDFITVTESNRDNVARLDNHHTYKYDELVLTLMTIEKKVRNTNRHETKKQTLRDKRDHLIDNFTTAIKATSDGKAKKGRNTALFKDRKSYYDPTKNDVQNKFKGAHRKKRDTQTNET